MLQLIFWLVRFVVRCVWIKNVTWPFLPRLITIVDGAVCVAALILAMEATELMQMTILGWNMQIRRSLLTKHRAWLVLERDSWLVTKDKSLYFLITFTDGYKPSKNDYRKSQLICPTRIEDHWLCVALDDHGDDQFRASNWRDAHCPAPLVGALTAYNGHVDGTGPVDPLGSDCESTPETDHPWISFLICNEFNH